MGTPQRKRQQASASKAMATLVIHQPEPRLLHAGGRHPLTSYH